MLILSQTEHASDDRWFGEAGRDKTATSNNTGHRLGSGLFLHLEGRRLDWKGKNALAHAKIHNFQFTFICVALFTILSFSPHYSFRVILVMHIRNVQLAKNGII